MKKEKVMFVAPAKLYPVDDDGSPLQPLRQNVSLPALTVLGSLRSDFDVSFVDATSDGYEDFEPYGDGMHRHGLPDRDVLERVVADKTDYLLINSMFTGEQGVVDELASYVKESLPDIKIVVGGRHASAKPEWILENSDIDFVVLGEGEETTKELLTSLGHGDPGRVSGIAYRKNGEVVRTGMRKPIQDLDREFAFDEVLWRDGEYRYDDRLSRRSGIYSHMTNPDWKRNYSLYYSRGCPFYCDYCSASASDGRKIRHAGSKRMFSDFRALHEDSGVNIFYNQSDTLGLSHEDIEFLKMVKEYRKLDKDFVLNNPNAFFMNLLLPPPDFNVNESLLDLLAGCGVNAMTLAVESFNPRYNRKMQRESRYPERISELSRAIQERGMKTELYMMYAFPGQELGELSDDEGKAEKVKYMDAVSWHRCMVFPGTKYYERGLMEGWFTEDSYRRNLKGGHFVHSYNPGMDFSNIPSSDLREFSKRHTAPI